MSSNRQDKVNPFAPSRPARNDSEGQETKDPDFLDDLLSTVAKEDEEGEYRIDYRPEDFEYDPDELLDDEEEPELPHHWNERGGPPQGGPPEADQSERVQSEGSQPPERTDVEPEPDSAVAGPARAPTAGPVVATPARVDPVPLAERSPEPGEQSAEVTEPAWYDAAPESDDGGNTWPLGLVIVGMAALVLLAVGGVGVLQERAEMQENILDLQSRLAVAVGPEQLAAERAAHRDLVERSEALEASLAELQLENRQLSDTVRGLESPRATQGLASGQAAREPTAPDQSTAVPKGDWFVNFGSYAQRSLAETWAGRLSPRAGEVVVIAAPGGDVFRVRVVSLPDQRTARDTATALQEEYGLSDLWVGRE